MDDPRKDRYNHQEIEAKWQNVWAETKLDVADIHKKSLDSARDRGPFYNLMMFPYPSAEGLHIGNMYAFTGSDIYGRFKRMQGYNVFEPIGLDGFGIHSENFALKIGRHPMDHAKITEKHFYDQLHRMGAMFDFTRTLETYDPSYYRWTQWLFVQLFKAGLAYRGKATVNFCPSCKTVLADEQVITRSKIKDQKSKIEETIGVCERCGNEVEKRALEQWFFRITAYAEKLLGNIPKLKWSEKVKVAQTNWIGKKEGISITYPVVTEDGTRVGEVSCFTTRPDTNFGATFVVLAPEHEFVEKILSRFPPTRTARLLFEEIQTYVSQSKQKSDQERISEGKKKTGVFTGLYCVNPLNNYKMPLFISDFVLSGFGTGAVVGVPGHDRRDFHFAKALTLPIKRVIVGKDGDTSSILKEEQVLESSFAEASSFTKVTADRSADKEGTMVNSGFLDGMDSHEASVKMMDYLEEKGWGKRTVTYHLRDWLISRQRYWGPPIPMIYCKACAKEGKGWFSSKEAAEVANENLDSSSVADAISPSTPSLRASEAEQNFVRSPQFHKSMFGWFPVPEDQLPVLLPRIEDYKPSVDGIAPLSKHKEFFDTVCPGCGKPAVRETDVSDTFLDSSWYFLRYPSLGLEDRVLKVGVDDRKSKIEKKSHLSSTINLPPLSSMIDYLVPFDPIITKKWLPVHMYTGGAEHSVLHLLYSRYITMVLHDLGYLDFDEPFTNFFAHGLIIKNGMKMSKSKGNVVNPDEYIPKYGADAIRLYLMFMGPLSMGGDFSDTGMEGMSRWVGRVWRVMLRSLENLEKVQREGVARVEGSPSSARIRQLAERTSDGGKPVTGPHENSAETSEEVKRLLEKTIAKLTDDMEKRRYNTAIASLMELTNAIVDEGGALGEEELKKYICLLAPFAPYMTEEAWNRLHGRETYTDPQDSVHRQPWSSYDPRLIEDEKATIVVQINGKTRGTIEISQKDAKNQEVVETRVRGEEKFAKYFTGPVKKTIFVPGKLINFVV
jgi:leucyl-tRNA synthetase